MASFNGDIGTPSRSFNLKVEYSYSQSISGNYTDITATGYVKRNRSSVSPYNSSSSSTLTVDGESASYTVSYNLSSDGYKSIVSKSKRVYHNSNGTKSITISFSFNGKLSSYYPNGSISQTITLPTIPRYAVINSFTVNKKDETSFTFNWSANATIDYVWYSVNNGSSWAGYDTADGTSGSFTVSGLSANTTYNCKLRVRRKDSQLTTDSSAVSQTTYDYPYCTSSPNFTIGNSLTLSFYNPLKRNVTVSIIGADGTIHGSDTTTGTSIAGYNNDGWKNWWYSTIPNATSGKYQVKVVYGSSTKTRNNSNTYTINANDCKPTFSNFEYSTNLLDLTGDNETIINGKTNTTITISSTNKAIGNYSATIQRYALQCGTQDTKYINYSNDSISTTLNECNSDILKVTAIDSRGLETTITKTVTNFKNYFIPTFISFNVDRENGIDTTSYLNLKLQFWNYNFGDENNEIKELNYRVKEQGTSTWSNWFTINTSSLVINQEQATLTNYLVYLDGISQGFTIGKTYNFQLQVIDGSTNDALSTIESNIFNLVDGKVAISVLKDNNEEYHIGINGMPDNDFELNVTGKIGINGEEVKNLTPKTTTTTSDDEVYSCNYINNLQKYSTSEQEIGTWVDGKTIYRKVIQDTMSASQTSKSVSLGLSNVSDFISCDARVIRANNYSQNSNINMYYYNSTDYFSCYMNTPSSKSVSVRGGTDWPKRPYDFVVIVEYTKTSN